MAIDTAAPSLGAAQLEQFERDGYTIAPGLFTAAEVQEMIDTFDALHARGEVPGCFKATPLEQATDPLEA